MNRNSCMKLIVHSTLLFITCSPVFAESKNMTQYRLPIVTGTVQGITTNKERWFIDILKDDGGRFRLLFNLNYA